MVDETVGDIEVARYALRTFKFDVHTGEFGSVVKNVDRHWADGTCEAKCLAFGRHPAPDENCSCGIYGTVTLQSLMEQYPRQAEQFTAVIAAEGATIIGDRGLRTAYARVVAYWTPTYPKRSRRSLAKQGKRLKKRAGQQFRDAKTFDDLDEMLALYGIPRNAPEPAAPEQPWAGPIITTATKAAMVAEYVRLAGGGSTYIYLHYNGQQIAGPAEAKLLSTTESTARWESVTLPVPALNGEVWMTLGPTPGGPPMDKVSIGRWDMKAGEMNVTPTFTYW